MTPSGTLEARVQYLSDADGKEVGVIVPIELWHEIEAALAGGEEPSRRHLFGGCT